MGTPQRILVEGGARRGGGELCGRTANNRVVNFSGPARLIGEFVDVMIETALPHSLRGAVLTGARGVIASRAAEEGASERKKDQTVQGGGASGSMP